MSSARLALRALSVSCVALLSSGACATNYGAVVADAPPQRRAASENPRSQDRGPARLTSADVPLPRAGSQTPVALGELLAFADHHAPGLVLARARRSRARAELLAAEIVLPQNPQTSLAVGPRITGDGAALDLQLNISQAIPIGGQRGFRREAAKRLWALSAAQAADAAWQLRRAIVSAYFRVLAAARELEITKQQRAFAQELSSIANKRLKAGAISPLQPKLAEVEVQQAQQAVLVAKGNLLGQRIALATLVGWPTDRPPVVRGAFRQPIALPSATQLATLAGSRQPALMARRRQVELARARLDLARRSAWPNPSVGLSYQLEGDPSGAGVEQHVLFFTLGVGLPLWRRNQGARARARADLLVAKAEAKVAQQRLGARVSRALAAVRAAEARLRLFEGKILPSYTKNLKLLRRAFELGEVGLLSVLVGRGRILQSRRAALAAKVSYCGALLDLEALVGPLSDKRPAKGATP